MTKHDDDKEDLRQRLEAHRGALAALAMVLNEVAPGTFENFIAGLATFEHGARMQNEADAMIDEFRQIRLGLEAMLPELPSGPLRTPEPPGDTEK